MATLFYGFALISFAVGAAITVGPNPTFQMNDGKRGAYTLSGPVWGFAAGILLALALCFIALCYSSRKS